MINGESTEIDDNSTHTLPTHLPPRAASTSRYAYLPKKIYQTWQSNKVTQGMYDAVYAWIDKNPQWEYYLFDDQACRDFLLEHFPDSVVETYDALQPTAYKADLWRYCLLYINGGVYCDIKQELQLGLDEVLPRDVKFLSVKDRCLKEFEFDGYLYQAFMVAMPKHPFLGKAIELIVENVKRGWYGHSPLSITGPGLLGQALNLVLARAPDHPHTTGTHCVNSHSYTLWEIESSSLPYRIFTNKKMLAIVAEYASYRAERTKRAATSITVDYRNCWACSQVYAHGVERQDYSENYTRLLRGFIKSLYRAKAGKKARSLLRLEIHAGHIPLWQACILFFRFEVLRMHKSRCVKRSVMQAIDKL